ncbi:hypothetical protein ACIPRU_24945 [Streptomyces sp. NPDC090126]|uniref:hypothetical protein n=1 Tax=Streptomyces sp. NPDC090126 TaxID=3365952 RepID=UPI0037F93CE8
MSAIWILEPFGGAGGCSRSITAVRSHGRAARRRPELGRFLPEGAEFAVLGGASGFPNALAAPYGLLLLVGWTAAMSPAGTRLFTRRDV